MLILAAVILATLPPPVAASHSQWGIEVTLRPAQTKAGQTEDFTVTLTNSGDLTVTVCQLDIQFVWDTEPQNLFTGTHNIPKEGNWSRTAGEAIPPSIARGTYSVTITVSAMTLIQHPCSSHDWIENIDIVPNRPPTADFSFVPKTPTPNAIVYFTDNSSDSDGTIEEWQWDFGDGTSSTEQHPVHAFAAARDYEVVLIVRDNNDDSGEESQIVRISSNLPPLAGFSWDLSNANPTMSVQFRDGSSDPDGFIVRWHWDFDDGMTSTEQDPSHEFPAAGSYDVVLTVTDNEGASSSSSRTVVIGGPSGGTKPSGFGLLEWGLVGAILASTALVTGLLIRRTLRPARRWGQTNVPPPSEEPKRRWRPR